MIEKWIDREKAIRTCRTLTYAVFGLTVFLTLPYILTTLLHPSENVSVLPACTTCALSHDTFTDVVIRARSAYVYDVTTQTTLFSYNGDAQLPLASVTKAMTALLAHELISSDEEVEVQSSDLLVEGDSGLSMYERFKRNDLIDFTLSVSSNDGARTLARVAGTRLTPQEGDEPIARFIRSMNERAQSLGLVQTFFLNESGLDESTYVAGAYGSAHDMAMLFAEIVRAYPELLEATTYPSLSIPSSIGTHTAKNTNSIAGKIPGLIGSKTGFTDLAGGNLVIVFEPEPLHPVVIAVLGSTSEDRFADTDALVGATVAMYAPE
ncbi:MAG: D-alanyl-D-alanine carboxypeptidase [Candidatus Yonathbacteria bacterium]|nr:D-alanyl-D-alanine carboxypeptidase [Candidatus Yonathbacteria bacterium]